MIIPTHEAANGSNVVPSHGAGRRRPMMQPNYHTMTNNAVFPTDGGDDVIQYHTKVVRGGNKAKLMPTLRTNQAEPTARIQDGQVNRDVNNYSPQMSGRQGGGSPIHS